MSAIQTPEKNKRLVRRLYEDCINPGKVELLAQLIADDFVGGRGEKGPSEFANTIVALRNGFPDIQFDLEDLIAEGDRVAVRWKFQATHMGPFAGFPPSQKQVTQTAIVIYQVRDGKIIRAWLQPDRLGLLQQIGALPSLATGSVSAEQVKEKIAHINPSRASPDRKQAALVGSLRASQSGGRLPQR
ncbi:MAG: ester cyclase [Betaproteobacteria bacterium]|nr:ester cyclase [Betaproteobacteria bacterium]